MGIADIQRALREEKLDGWLFFDHHERDPIAYRVLMFRPPAVPTRRWYYFVPADGEPRALLHRVEPGMLDALPGVRTYYSSWLEQEAGLRSLVGDARRVAMQYSPQCAVPYVAMVDAGTVELVRGLGVEVVTSADLVQLFEARWSDRQIETHLEAGRRVDEIRRAAFEKIGDRLRRGVPVNEFQIRQFIRGAFDRAGLVTDHGPIVAVNANASNPHYEPTEEVHAEIRPGDWVLIDLWAKLAQPDAVYYDITWTGYCGTDVPELMRKVFEVVRQARDLAVVRVREAIAAGERLRGCDVDDAAREHIREQGYGAFFFHRTGHSIGREVHGAGANMDNLESHDERRILAGTCFSIEPGIYLAEFGVRSEVNVLVGEREARVTGDVQTAPVHIG